ncbi:13604_t:CDS:1, partial [Rhizophagus irregularis]
MTDSSSLTPTSHDDDSFNILSNVDTIEESNENMSHVTSPSIQRHDDKIDINQENVVMSEFSFFYRPCNDFQIYHVVCKEKTSDEI